MEALTREKVSELIIVVQSYSNDAISMIKRERTQSPYFEKYEAILNAVNPSSLIDNTLSLETMKSILSDLQCALIDLFNLHLECRISKIIVESDTKIIENQSALDLAHEQHLKL
jgi:hypothetical protein